LEQKTETLPSPWSSSPRLRLHRHHSRHIRGRSIPSQERSFNPATLLIGPPKRRLKKRQHINVWMGHLFSQISWRQACSPCRILQVAAKEHHHLVDALVEPWNRLLPLPSRSTERNYAVRQTAQQEHRPLFKETMLLLISPISSH
jgi:hypothetical protein